MRTRTTTTALIAAGLLALTACGTEPEPAAPAAGPTASASTDPEDQYLSTAHDITFNGAPTDDELTELPPQWCDALADGHSVEWAFDPTGGDLYPIGQEWGTVQKDAYTLLVAGVRAYCPEYLDTVTDELRESGDY
ncbi:DUF732 domain-containing protein [Streptomyces microflavus]|uniref:DUF732 domain-containing protein n=1 Tax=Streptomyces microflavus TaxID=1919 RepID=UPI0033C0B3DE